jgi:glycosyltransferase involved in cell wall biosynthesis
MAIIASRDALFNGSPAPMPAGRPLRVAFVVHTFDMGGLERCVARLVSRLDRACFQPMIVCMTRNGTAAEWIDAADPIPVVELHKGRRNGLLTIRRFARVLQQHDVDIVHSHNWGTLMETTCARRLARVPTHVHAERGTVMGGPQVRGIRRLLRSRGMRWALGQADAVMSNAVSVAERVSAACGFPATAIRVIPNGVDEHPAAAVSQRLEIRRKLRIGDRAVLIGSVGRLVPVKGFGTAVEAMAQVVSGSVDAHLMLVGDGPELHALRNQAQALGIAHRVHLVGWHDDAAAHLAAMDIYVNTSVSEGMSQSIGEAMAARLPLIVSDVGDSGRIVGGDEPCGLVVPPQNAAALAKAVAELAGDSQRRSFYADRARRRQAQHFSVAGMVRSYERLYLELAGVVQLANSPM